MTEEFFKPRGIGLNWLTCFICGKGGNHKCQPDMASFVADREAGERIHAWFVAAGLTGWLDYRPSEPQWVQYKLGACKEHLPLLERLGDRCYAAGKRITPEIVAAIAAEARRLPSVEPPPAEDTP